MTLKLKPKKVIQLADKDCGLNHSIIRVPNVFIDSARQDRSKFFRREALLISNPETGDSIIRFAMGSNALKGLTNESIALDYDGVDALSVQFNRATELNVQRASRRQLYRWFYNHPDLLVQISCRLGIFGAVMGILGFGIGLFSVIITFI